MITLIVIVNIAMETLNTLEVGILDLPIYVIGFLLCGTVLVSDFWMVESEMITKK